MKNLLSNVSHYRSVLLKPISGPLGKGAILSILVVGIGTGIGWFSQVFLSRTIGPEQFGIYAYVVGLMGVARTLLQFSIDRAAVRYISIYLAAEKWSLFSGFMYASRLLTLVTALAGMVVGIVVAYVASDWFPEGITGALIAGCILLVPMMMLELESSLLQAFRLVMASRVPMLIVRPVLFVATLAAAVYLFGVNGTASLAILANTGGFAVAVIISFVIMQRHIPAGARAAAPKYDNRVWAAFCAMNVSQDLIYLILSQQADVVIVGTMINTTEAGIYSASSQIAAVSLLGMVAVNHFFQPVLSDYEANRPISELQRVLWRIILINIATSVPLILACILFGHWLLYLFDPSFVVGYPVVMILIVGCLVNAIWGGLWGDLLTMTGRYKVATAIVTVACIANVVATIILTPLYGMIGAAAATTAAVLLRAILVALAVHRDFGFWPWTVWRIAPESYSPGR